MAGGQLVVAEHRIYVRSANGDRVEAVDPASGKTLWVTPGEARPLWAWRDRVALLVPGPKGELVIQVALDTRHGAEILLTSAALGIPDWVPLYDVAVQRRSVVHRVRVRSKGNDLWLAWWAQDQVITGVRPPAPEHESSGGVRVDLSTGAVAALDEPVLPPDPDQAVPASLSGWKLSKGQLWAPCRCGGPDKPVRAGRFAVSVALEIEQLEKQERVWLLRWRADTGQPAEPVLLHQGARLFTILTGDGDHVLTSEKARTWTIHDLETGRRRGQVSLHGLAEVSILGGRLFEIHGKDYRFRLDAYDIATGRRLWKRPLWSARQFSPVP
ncbi:MAG: hypothetical protein GWO05_08105 [Gammaproteobacteria bacterium]|nr:hypothetical protein [Gammaproteobacteria bacterium]